MMEYSFPRYLAAKRSVDDRALNRHVWGALEQALRSAHPEQCIRVLEIGAGIGTMLERMVEWGALVRAEYTAIDSQPENITSAALRLPGWAERQGFSEIASGERLIFRSEEKQLVVDLKAEDLFEFLPQVEGQHWDVLVAHAFLDLINIPAALPKLVKLVRPGGLLYFTLNFDGLTILEPPVDSRLDEKIMRLYHQSMDERVVNEQSSGDSRSGRRLFGWLRAAGLEIIAAGSSDWTVFSRGRKYEGDEAYFLHFILHFFEQSLSGHPDLVDEPFTEWIAARRAQIAAGDLVYIAHQMDFLVRRVV